MWHILRVTPNLESEASALLMEDMPSLNIYNPQRVLMTYNRRNRVWSARVVSLFTGYLFVHIADPRHVKHRPSKMVGGFMRNLDRSFMAVLPRVMDRVKQLEAEIAAEPTKPSVQTPREKEVVARSFDELRKIALQFTVAVLEGETSKVA